jgi:hypothetical protein
MMKVEITETLVTDSALTRLIAREYFSTYCTFILGERQRLVVRLITEL